MPCQDCEVNAEHAEHFERKWFDAAGDRDEYRRCLDDVEVQLDLIKTQLKDALAAVKQTEQLIQEVNEE